VAISACENAIVVFKDNNLADLANGSQTNLAEAEAALAELL